MKIAVLTFFESENYGTVLQAYATQKYLENLGHDVELLHIKREVNCVSSHYRIVTQKSRFFERVRCKIVSVLKKKEIQRKTQAFKSFREEYLHVSKYYESGNALKLEWVPYDLCISGGDQIWNPYHKVFSLHYMFDFLFDQAPRIAYGSSFGVANIEDEEILSNMKDCLCKYQAIGVREQSGVEIIRKMELTATQVVDPVFLLKDEWKSFVKNTPPRKKKYCLIYALIGYPKEENAKIHHFAKQRGIEVVILPFNRQNSLNGFKKEFGLSPEEFLNYVAHAEFVFTNSFHGLAFSILFQKQFILLGCDSDEGLAKRTRLIDLLEQVGIGDRSFDRLSVDVNYSLVYERLFSRVNESKKYIQKAIKETGWE